MQKQSRDYKIFYSKRSNYCRFEHIKLISDRQRSLPALYREIPHGTVRDARKSCEREPNPCGYGRIKDIKGCKREVRDQRNREINDKGCNQNQRNASHVDEVILSGHSDSIRDRRKKLLIT